MEIKFSTKATSTLFVEVVSFLGTTTTTKELKYGGYCVNGVGKSKF